MEQKPDPHHRDLSDFFNNEALSDIEITSTDQTYKCHKIVLAASSDYFNKLFTDNKIIDKVMMVLCNPYIVHFP